MVSYEVQTWMRNLWADFTQRVCTPLRIFCIVVFIILPIILAIPLFIWLIRQRDRLSRWNRVVTKACRSGTSPQLTRSIP